MQTLFIIFKFVLTYSFCIFDIFHFSPSYSVSMTQTIAYTIKSAIDYSDTLYSVFPQLIVRNRVTSGIGNFTL